MSAAWAAEQAHDAGGHGGGHAGGGLAIDPLHQFQIQRIVHLELFGLDFSFTNASLFMLIAVLLISLLLIYGMRERALVPGRLQSVAELSYEFVANMVRENTGREGMQYFPFIFSLFMFILFLNT